MAIRTGHIFLWGWVGGWVGGGGGGYLSLSDEWRVTDILAQMWENGAQKAPEIFLACRRGKRFFFAQWVCTQNAQIFVENSNAGEKHEKKFGPLPRPPSGPLAPGPSI